MDHSSGRSGRSPAGERTLERGAERVSWTTTSSSSSSSSFWSKSRSWGELCLERLGKLPETNDSSFSSSSDMGFRRDDIGSGFQGLLKSREFSLVGNTGSSPPRCRRTMSSSDLWSSWLFLGAELGLCQYVPASDTHRWWTSISSKLVLVDEISTLGARGTRSYPDIR